MRIKGFVEKVASRKSPPHRHVQLDDRLEDITTHYSTTGGVIMYIDHIVDCFHQNFMQDEFNSEISYEE